MYSGYGKCLSLTLRRHIVCEVYSSVCFKWGTRTPRLPTYPPLSRLLKLCYTIRGLRSSGDVPVYWVGFMSFRRVSCVDLVRNFRLILNNPNRTLVGFLKVIKE